jgi:hypothetical protein
MERFQGKERGKCERAGRYACAAAGGCVGGIFGGFLGKALSKAKQFTTKSEVISSGLGGMGFGIPLKCACNQLAKSACESAANYFNGQKKQQEERDRANEGLFGDSGGGNSGSGGDCDDCP